MFKTNKKIQNQLHRARSAYLYPDGVVIVTADRVKVPGKPKETKEVEIAHVYHCPIRFGWNNNGDNLKPRRIVVHDPLLLMHGVERVEVYYHGGSEAMKKLDIDTTSITLTTPDGGKIKDHEFRFLSSDLHAQPQPATVDPFSSPYSDTWTKERTIDQWVSDYFAIVDELPLPQPTAEAQAAAAQEVADVRVIE